MSKELILMAAKHLGISIEDTPEGIFIREENDILHRIFDPMNNTADAIICAHYMKASVKFQPKLVQVGRSKELHNGILSESAEKAFRIAATKEAARRYIKSIETN